MSAKEKKKSYKASQVYKINGQLLERKNPTCPKCGPGVYMAVHKDRNSCGRCGFMEKKK